MERRERWIYRDMLDVYYDKEQPFPGDLADVCSMVGVRSDEERAIVADLLRSKFVKTDSGYTHARCDLEILSYRSKADAAKENGKKGGRPNKNNPNKPSGFQSGFDSVSEINPSETGSQAKHEPITKNQSTEAKASVSRPSKKCPASFELTADLLIWAETEAPGIDAHAELAKLRDHTFSTARVDWAGTWRNWMRKAFKDHAERHGARDSPQDETPYQRSMRKRYEEATGSPGAHRITDITPMNTLEIEQ